MENNTEILDEIEKLSLENKTLLQKLREAKEAGEKFIRGQVDALVIADKKDLKIYTETTADKTYRILIEKMNEGAVTLNRDGIILYSNFAFANLVNLPLQRVIGGAFINFIGEPSKEHLNDLVKQGWDTIVKGEVNIIANDGRVIPTVISINSLQLDDKLVLSIILTDISLRHAVQEELKSRTRQLEQTNLELSRVNQELAIQNKEIDKQAAELKVTNKNLEQIVYIASHDLQEPLRTISNFVGLIEKEFSGKLVGADQYFKFIVTATTKMQTLIKDLLDYSRLGLKVVLATVNCNDVLKEVILSLGASIKQSNAKITSAILPVVTANETELKQLFQNLLSNAVKFHKVTSTPEVIITVEEKNSEYVFAIKDNGIGIEEKYKDRIFVIFQRLNNDTEYPGNGIGLATAKKIVERHNGKIWYESKLGEGSTFYFTLPKENVK